MKKSKVIANDKNEDIAKELMGYSYTEIENELIPAALKKMQEYLVTNGVANKFSDIKRKPRIEIKGLDDNGAERLLGKEVRERFGLDAVEASLKFNTYYPLWSEGVIKYASAMGNHYTYFNVVSQEEKTFDMEIREYKYFHNTFYLTYIIEAKGISKYEPFHVSEFIGKDVRRIFFDLCNERENDFSELEKRIANSAISLEQNAEEELDIIMHNTMANIRVVNYLWEAFQNSETLPISGSFYDNEFFKVKKWKHDVNVIYDLDEIYSQQMEEYIYQLLQPSEEPKILRKNTIEKVINGIITQKDVSVFNAAAGFVFLSGLHRIKEVFEATEKGKCKTDLIIGALQHYADKHTGNKIDRATVRYLEDIRRNSGVRIYTYTHSFYHGKFYYLQDSQYAYIIVGSSNISKTAFSNNFELDCLYVVDKNSNKDMLFLSWFEKLKAGCIEIEKLNEKDFENYQWESELDVFQSIKNQKVSLEDVKKRIASLTDEETKFRLNLWLEHEPVVVYDNVDNAALKAYSMFVFPEQEMVVFESFVPQNAFYVFGCPNGVEELLISISKMSKTQMALSAHFIERGRHVANKDNLKVKINRLFK